jgi:class 3 adenylate cyclase/tetratricopeptide (TPR) repeat protein
MAACPSCGGENREGARFCDACGQALAGEPRRVGNEERKVVTVLFCDLVGFTAASEAVDPEEVRARLRPYHELLRDRIEAFGGTVEKFVGDAVMAVFGAPTAHEDDAERAIRAALAILERLDALNEADPGLALTVRVGINTGEALVALDARPEHGEGFVTGDVVNTASRIQSAAPVDGIAVGESTYSSTERVFEWQELPDVELKGKAAPVALWRPVGARARFGSDVIRSVSTPLVGRELDFLQLRTAFEKAAREPSVQLVTVVGEPGVGKSRLVAELAAHIDALQELVRWRQGRCLPYGEGIAFWALGEIVKAQAGIYDSDSPEEATRKLEVAIPAGDDTPWLRARLLPLVGVDPGVTAGRDESFTAWRRFLESIAEQQPGVLVFEDLHWADEALLDFLEHLADWAQGVPLLVVCTARPELLERRPTWGAGLRNASTIGLSPLSEADTAELVAMLLDRAVLPVETQQALLQRAGGNPLYAEEFVRMLRDRDLLDEHGALRSDRDVPHPDSLQALIAARLDTLTPESKAILQDAAVVGKIFWTGSVAAIGGHADADLQRILHELARKELVRPSRQSSMEGEQELGFWHALVRDVAYRQIPRAERARKHVAAAEWIESRAGDRVEDLADVLAHHTGEAIALAETSGEADLARSVAPRARRYALLAGERALGLDAERAQSLLRRALGLTPEDDDAYPSMLLRYCVAAYQLGHTDEAETAAERAVASFRARGDVVRTGEALTLLSFTRHRRERVTDEAIELLESVPPGPELVAAYTQAAGEVFVGGDHRQAILTSEKALTLADQLGLPVPARALGFHGGALINVGEPEKGLDEMLEARRLLVEAGLGRDAAVASNNYAINLWILEGVDTALEAMLDNERFARERGLREIAASGSSTVMSLLVESGRLRDALDRAASTEEMIVAGVMNISALAEFHAAVSRALEELGDDAGATEAALLAREHVPEGDHGLAELAIVGPAWAGAAVRRGDDDGVRELLRRLLDWKNAAANEEYAGRLPALVRRALAAGALELAARLPVGVDEMGLPLFDHAFVSAQALLAEARGELREAAEAFDDAATRWEGFGARLEQAYALQGKGRCLAALGDAGAGVPLRAARALFDEMGARPRVKECDVLLAAALAEGA